MRTVTFTSVIQGILARMGMDPTLTPQGSILASLTEYVNSALRANWEVYPWPDLLNYEMRQFYPNWSSAAGYAPGNVVLASNNAYYFAVAPSANVNPLTDSTNIYWSSVSPQTYPVWNSAYSYAAGALVQGSNGSLYWAVQPSTGQDPTQDTLSTYWQLSPISIPSILWAISLDQPSQTPIGEVLSVSRNDPRTSPNPLYLPWVLTEDGVVITPIDPNAIPPMVCVVFSSRPPVFTPSAYTDPSQVIPYVLAEGVKYLACAHALREDGQYDKASAMDEQADEYFNLEIDKIEMKQGQQRRFSVLTR